jgi:hypothetical protein
MKYLKCLVFALTLGAVAGPATAQIWEFDPFDNLALGNLSGQNGWAALPSPQVIGWSFNNRVVRLNQNGVQVSSNKDVADQFVGTHTCRFTAIVQNANLGTASEAKLEIRSPVGGLGWDKKVQVFFGSSIRVNYHPNGAAVTVVNPTVSSTPYDFRVDVNLGSNLADVYVNGILVAVSLPVQAGPITSLDVTGFVRGNPATVLIENLECFRLF